jgi:hypothetical protein
MTQIPWFDNVWYKNSFTAMFRKTTGFSILRIVGKYIAERQEARTTKTSTEENLADRDMLSQFFDIQINNPALPPWCVAFIALAIATALPSPYQIRKFQLTMVDTGVSRRGRFLTLSPVRTPRPS